MATVAKLSEDGQSLKIIYTSKPINKKTALLMQGLFKEHPKAYTVQKDFFGHFIERIRLNISPNDKKIGLAILPGKLKNQHYFHLALEAIRYVQEDDGDPIDSCHPISNEEYFGLLSTNLTTYQEKEHRPIVLRHIEDKDDQTHPYRTEIILVTFKELELFLKENSKSETIELLLSRDRASFRLTIILKGQNNSYMFLDQHDLIPPPPDEV